MAPQLAPFIPLLKKVALPMLKKVVTLAIQALSAGIAEESSHRADKEGYRGKNGQFKSKVRAVLDVIVIFSVVALLVNYIPAILAYVLHDHITQGIGLCLILGTYLVHKMVDTWTLKNRDYFVIGIGCLLVLTPYLLNFL